MESKRITAADLADTGQWRLIIYVSETGMRAYLTGSSGNNLPVGLLFSESWEADPDELLHDIENAVYDHPRVLDDFAADIILATDKVMWVEPTIADSDSTDELFTSVFRGMEGEAHMDDSADPVAMFAMVKGLKSFLNRTFPGARVRSHLAVELSMIPGIMSEGVNMWIDVRKDKADFLFMDSGKLLAGVSHDWAFAEDIIYYLFLILDVFSIPAGTVKVHVLADCKVFGALEEGLEDMVESVAVMDLPEVGSDSEMPLAARLCAARNTRKQ